MRLPLEERRLFPLALGIVVAITLVRVAVLVFTPLQLYPDEAQYWWWSRSPDWGYFSKPPLIAWIIRATTMFGDPEWAVRLASPFFHAGTALLVYAIGRRAFSAKVGFWSALAYITLPGVSYSSGLISTDVPLLFCWAVALYAFLRALDDLHWKWPLLCGLAVGFGLLAKYAMLYFVLEAVLAAFVSSRARHLLLSGRGVAILAIGLAILGPNLVWNAVHHFPTVAHTQANADWAHARFSVCSMLEFVLGQCGVFGPLMMLGFVVALWRLRSRERWNKSDGIVLVAFSLPVFALVILQSFISEANANWAAVAYVAAVPLAIAVLLRWLNGGAVALSLALGMVAMLSLWAVSLHPPMAEAVGQGNAFKRMEGWRALGRAVSAEANAGEYDAIAAANRSLLAELLYYARPRSMPVRAWDQNLAARDHFQMTMPLRPNSHRVLVVIAPEEEHRVSASFDSFVPLRSLKIPVSGNRARITELCDARGYHSPQPSR
jgi:4-amino-4-deoxy-L-arabinose transferase-like glycosyltransferase